MNANRRSCLSVGELLTAAALVVILAAILLPAFAQARDALPDLMQRFPGTALSACARFRVGDLHWLNSQADRAAETWQDVWESEAYAWEAAPNLLERLVEARYCAGTNGERRNITGPARRGQGGRP